MSFFNRLFSAPKTSVQVNNERLVAQARAQQAEQQAQQKAADVDLSVLKDADEILQVNALMEATQKAKVEAEKAAAEKAKQNARRVLMSNVLDAKSTAFDNLSKALKAKAEATAKAETEAELIKEAAASVEDELAAILNQAFVTVVVKEKSETTTEANHVVEEKSETIVERQLPVPPAPPVRKSNVDKDEVANKLNAYKVNLVNICKGDKARAESLFNTSAEDMLNAAKSFAGMEQFDDLLKIWSAARAAGVFGAPPKALKDMRDALAKKLEIETASKTELQRKLDETQVTNVAPPRADDDSTVSAPGTVTPTADGPVFG